jgi:hypothetical protein
VSLGRLLFVANLSIWSDTADESSTTKKAFRQSLWQAITDFIFIRLLTFIFLIQAALMWIAFALNFVFQLLFLPFDNEGMSTFIGSWLAIPGVVFL